MTLRLIAERSISYAPHHVADHAGFFADEGVEVVVDFDSGPGGSWLADRLADGSADIARGGVWIPLAYRGRLEDSRIFAQICNRNFQQLLGRPGQKPFDVHDLEGRTVLLPMAATSQWMFFEGVLREAGVALDQVRFIRDLDVATMVRLWRAGLGDHLLIGLPVGQELIDEGHPISVSIPALGGAVPWSVYYAPKRVIGDRADELVAFTAGLGRGLTWICENSPEDVAELVRDDFPAIPHGVLTRSIARMQQDGVWISDPEVPSQSFARYQGIISAYGLTASPLPHNEAVAVPIAALANERSR